MDAATLTDLTAALFAFAHTLTAFGFGAPFAIGGLIFGSAWLASR